MSVCLKCSRAGWTGPRFWCKNFASLKASLNASLFKGAFKEGFTGVNFLHENRDWITVVEMAHSHSMAKELSKELSKKHSKKQIFYTRIGPLSLTGSDVYATLCYF